MSRIRKIRRNEVVFPLVLFIVRQKKSLLLEVLWGLVLETSRNVSSSAESWKGCVKISSVSSTKRQSWEWGVWNSAQTISIPFRKVHLCIYCSNCSLPRVAGLCPLFVKLCVHTRAFLL